MLRLMSFASVVFSILYFSVSFPFSKVISAAFPNEAEVASFLGLFSAVATLITLLVSLVVANRLYARIGIVNAVLILPFVYLGGFILWSQSFSLATAVLVPSRANGRSGRPCQPCMECAIQRRSA